MCKVVRMKKLSFRSTSTQRDELLNLTKSSNFKNAKLKELNNFIHVLRQHYQESKPGTFVREDLNVAVENTEAIINAKRADKAWHEKPIGLIGIGLAITIISSLFVAGLSN